MSYEMVDRNLRMALRLFSQSSERGEFHHHPGIVMVSSGFDSCAFNPAILSEGVANEAQLDRLLEVPRAHYSQRNLAWSFWACTEYLHGRTRGAVASHLTRRGYRLLLEAPGMVGNALRAPDRDLPRLDCRRVENATLRFQFAHILSVCFEIAFPTAREIYSSEKFWSKEITGWVGFHDGLPVASAAVVESDGCLGLYSVGTLPGFQRRGFAETIVRTALSHARQQTGLHRMILQSTRQGYSLYERLGFRSVTSHVVFQAPRG